MSYNYSFLTDPIWDWDTETSSVNETDQSWSNISLDSEDDRPLGGTLQFQSEDSKLMVHDDNIEKYTTENVPLNGKCPNSLYIYF